MGNRTNAHKRWRQNVTTWRTSKKPRVDLETTVTKENINPFNATSQDIVSSSIARWFRELLSTGAPSVAAGSASAGKSRF
ncbi:hypothetical protein CY34DRAFT_19569 [Suillus luteus UH-Slu-Lm8-n1]|uniref:Uncharacterized protein n=1 Tax=Suillus luteus UH-Slu-Lm8-n1 TaxID=930992 RepID=A0A0C9Z2V6_9AGAM|nr:hypothetical protein CY34DRAFT_19569 [Suillus luteus UH-Slu-Lm8-n1]